MVGLVTYTTGMFFFTIHIIRSPCLMNSFPHLVLPSMTSSDTFDENTPPLSDPNYISSLGAATFRGMRSGDNDAIWLMQVSSFELLEFCLYM